LNPSIVFETIIEGDCNRLARSAGLAIAKKPGGTSFNPLVIFGDVGLGKTHLAHAIGNDVLNRFPGKTVLYVSSEKFTNQIIQSIKE
jgi:chromosomal replication initiator protein